MYRIKQIITHRQPSVDELVCRWMLNQFGWSTEFCKVRFDEEDSPGTIENEMFLLKKQGKIYIGVGGGMFDEHPANGQPRKEGECAATLLAKFMKVDRNIFLKDILKLALNDDLGIQPKDEAGRLLREFSLPKVIKMMYDNDSKTYGAVERFVFSVLNEHYESQVRFHRSSPEICRIGKPYDFEVDGKKFPMLVIHTDEVKAHDYALTKLHYHLVLQIRESGNWQIFSRNNSPVSKLMPLIGAKLKSVEAGLTGVKFTGRELANDGALEGVPHVYFFKTGGMIMNGSLTHPQPPTKLDPETIPELIKETLGMIDKPIFAKPVQQVSAPTHRPDFVESVEASPVYAQA